jgi:hypothetical protein
MFFTDETHLTGQAPLTASNLHAVARGSEDFSDDLSLSNLSLAEFSQEIDDFRQSQGSLSGH